MIKDLIKFILTMFHMDLPIKDIKKRQRYLLFFSKINTLISK